MEDLTKTKAVPTDDQNRVIFDKAALTKLYYKHFGDMESPEEMLGTMMLEILDIDGGPNQKDLKGYNYDFLLLMSFFDELFKPVRTPSTDTI